MMELFALDLRTITSFIITGFFSFLAFQVSQSVSGIVQSAIKDGHLGLEHFQVLQHLQLVVLPMAGIYLCEGIIVGADQLLEFFFQLLVDDFDRVFN